MGQITYRPYAPQDFNALSEIINATWGHEKSYSLTTAVRLSNAYLRLCLTEQTFTQVALYNGNPIGVIMGNSFRRAHMHSAALGGHRCGHQRPPCDAAATRN